MVFLDSTSAGNFWMGSTAFFSKLTSYKNKTFKIWVSLCIYNMLLRQNFGTLLKALVSDQLQ